MVQRSALTVSGTPRGQRRGAGPCRWHSAAGRLALWAGLALLLGFASAAWAQDPPPPSSLKTVPVPGPGNLYEFISNKAAAIRLGKALFWDMQVGSDGIQACASCHFHAGADSRSKNQLSPGLLNRPTADATFTPPAGVNYQLSGDDFPFRELSDPQDRASAPVLDTNDVASSQGAFSARFIDAIPGRAEDVVQPVADPDGFQVGGINARRVEPRHTPSVINAVFNNAVFNHRNFWDGRAQPEFNGVNVWGTRDPSARLYEATKPNELVPVQILLQNASLASQAVAPPTSPFEMSADGRSFREIGDKLGKKRGKKLVKIRPLAKQQVHPKDSVLGSLSRWPKPGLGVGSYEAIIKEAFRPEWWTSNRIIRVAADGTTTVIPKKEGGLTTNEYSLMEYNFSLFFGLAVQLYEATLVADDTPDRFMEGRGVLSPEAIEGLAIFLRQAPLVLPDGTRQAAGRCINCHSGPEFTDAAVSNILAQGETRNREGQDLDRAWNNIGVRPSMEDLAVGGMDPFGQPLAVTRLRPKSDRFIAVDGAFKVPTVRNVELTAPYFHNGGHLTLESVVEFYSRGGDVAPLIAADGTEIRPLSIPAMSAAEQQAMVAFLMSLTDERVRYRQAPFDHPQLFVPDGHAGDHTAVVEDSARPGQALDQMREIPAVGRHGGAALPNFLE